MPGQRGLAPTWRFLVRSREGFPDPEARRIQADLLDLGIEEVEEVSVGSVYYVRGSLKPEEIERLGRGLLADSITQEFEVTAVGRHPREGGDRIPASAGMTGAHTVEVAYHPGVRDPVEDSLKKGALDLGVEGVSRVHTAKEYVLTGRLSPEALARACDKLLVNATIQQVVTPENLKALLDPPPPAAPVSIETVHLLQASDTVLQRVSIDHQLSLSLEEMRAIQNYFRAEGREPTLAELETVAQTWSEHCKHKTFRGPILYTEEVAPGRPVTRTIPSLLKETIIRATEELKKPWCVSVFEDNSGVIEFDEEFDVCFKVETHNHPSALEPFGGASTGVGGVIRDILGTGLGAKPVASTDVFCFAPPDLPPEKVPAGMLSPRRIIRGVVAGVKDYGNKMGIPTVNGAVLFDERFVGNPLVYCGNVGLLPKGKAAKRVEPGMKVFVVGGRTGRDGIHGATFSSIALTTESETVSSTAVQIGDPITEKKMAEALLQARDEGLFAAVTDCGAGGLSSAVGEMAASCGARVHLEKVPLKYAGLTPGEIWISESQERMVLAVPAEKEGELSALFARHDVLAAPIGEFTNTGLLELFHGSHPVGTLKLDFLHHGVPLPARPARWSARRGSEAEGHAAALPDRPDLTEDLAALLGRWETCSKEWIVRQYDHEVQGGSVLKPFLGADGRGPSDAAVLRPRLGSSRAIVLANGINFRYGRIDPYPMAVLAVEEAIRQIIAVGGSLDRIALLDNFCWGDPARPEVLGTLVRAAVGCYDAAKAYGTPFISGKDSLHNEYRVGEKTIQIPGTLLISAIGILPDAAQAVSMDAKQAGNRLYIVGMTKPELGGSGYHDLLGLQGGVVPQADLHAAPAALSALSKAISLGLVRSAHDCSEGGIGVAAAEMAFAGGLGLVLELAKAPRAGAFQGDAEILFSESATRLLLEVEEEKAGRFEQALAGFPFGWIGRFQPEPQFTVLGREGRPVVKTDIGSLRDAWQRPFQEW